MFRPNLKGLITAAREHHLKMSLFRLFHSVLKYVNKYIYLNTSRYVQAYSVNFVLTYLYVDVVQASASRAIEIFVHFFLTRSQHGKITMAETIFSTITARHRPVHSVTFFAHIL